MDEKIKILLVDDEPEIIRTVKRRLESEGYGVSVATDGLEAVRLAWETHPDLVILDIMLPKMNGYEVCKKLRQSEDFRRVPVLILTAMTQEKDKSAGFACGADAYMRKPFRAQELLGKLRELIAGGAAGEAPGKSRST